MNDSIVILSTILGTIIGVVTITRYLFYTKSEVDKEIKKSEEVVEAQIYDIKDNIAEQLLAVERTQNVTREEIYNKMNANKESLESYLHQFINMINDLKQSDQDLSIQYISLVNSLKDELKNDYTSRYNDLLALINTKVNQSDFVRLEQKVDKLSDVITELKTIIQLRLQTEEK